MSETLVSLRRKIASAGKLESVVRTMKILAASSIGQYESAVRSLQDYSRTVELGLYVCLSKKNKTFLHKNNHTQTKIQNSAVMVFGSDQGLAGQFNDTLAEFSIKTLKSLPGKKFIWTAGERIYSIFEDAGLKPSGIFNVPDSVNTISPLGTKILLKTSSYIKDENANLYIFHNKPKQSAIYEPVFKRLLPLDAQWQNEITKISWPTKSIPEALFNQNMTLAALIKEYLFVYLFKACAESLMSENACRLAAMQRAEKNIDELLETLTLNFNQLRQSSIDAELFDVISGFEALRK